VPDSNRTDDITAGAYRSPILNDEDVLGVAVVAVVSGVDKELGGSPHLQIFPFLAAYNSKLLENAKSYIALSGFDGG